MSDNVAVLIDHAITMCEELDMMLSLHYEKKMIRFLFTKNDAGISWGFSMDEVEDISNINLLKKILTDKVYDLLDNART